MPDTLKSNGADQVMIVDGDELVLDSLRSLLELETDYNIVAFLDPEEALKHIESKAVDLVISDYRIPQMDGITFLSKVKEVDANITRIMLTGQAGLPDAIRAINEVGLFQYIEKPWDNKNLMLVIRNGLEKRKLMRELDRKVQEIEKAYNELQGLNNEILKAFA
ncbi:response regulator [bacterium]|nr:response regulator [bacterium]